MRLTREDIENLIIDEIHGHISEDDRALLMKIVDADGQFSELRAQLFARHLDASYQAGQAALHQNLNTVTILADARKRHRVRRHRRLFATAAVGLTAVGLTYSFLQPFNKPQAQVTSQQESQLNKDVHLKLSDGQVLDLSRDQQSVVSGMQLSSRQKELHYQGGSSARNEWATLTVPVGKDYSVLLSDGSRVQLNSASEIRFPTSFSSTREIYLEGEAYVEVAKNIQPFIVHFGKSRLQVLGTAFNVNTYEPGKDRLGLVSGAVRVIHDKDSMILKPGTEVISTDSGMQTGAFDQDDLLSWRKGIYVFHYQTFADMKAVISRMFGIDVVLDDKVIAKVTYNGFMDRKRPITTFLENMTYSGTVQYRFDKDSVLHLFTPKL